MTTDEKIKLIQEVGEEIVGEDELRKLLESDEELIAYDGFRDGLHAELVVRV